MGRDKEFPDGRKSILIRLPKEVKDLLYDNIVYRAMLYKKRPESLSKYIQNIIIEESERIKKIEAERKKLRQN